MRSSRIGSAAAGTLLCCVTATATTAAAAATAAAATAAAGQPRPAVVELFTSEGCSSCPPAEDFVGELARRADVLPLAFHVGYWDDLGWRDRFGLPLAEQRQQTYAKALGLASVYTPQVVLDGSGDYVGSDRASINKGLKEKRLGVPVAIAIRDGDVMIRLDAQAAAAPSDVFLVAYQRSAVSAIGRGENSGRTLAEFNIVRALQNLGRWDGNTQQYRAPVKSLPGDCTDVAVLVQAVGQGRIIGAATLPVHGW
jgi:hypothetical protein